MSVKPGDPGGGNSSRVQTKSCGGEEPGYSEAIDLLTCWILEDIDAVAKSFDMELSSVLEAALRQVRSEAPLFAEKVEV